MKILDFLQKKIFILERENAHFRSFVQGLAVKRKRLFRSFLHNSTGFVQDFSGFLRNFERFSGRFPFL